MQSCGLGVVLLGLGLVLGQPAAGADQPFSLYLVRHAEKIDDSRDPPLSGAGERRAERLAWGLGNLGIEAVWTSDFRRTRDTGFPTASGLGLELKIYDPRALGHLAEQLLVSGQTALVVGHSDTTPQLASLLCACEVAAIGHEEYDRLLIIEVDGTGRRLSAYTQESFYAAAAPP